MNINEIVIYLENSITAVKIQLSNKELTDDNFYYLSGYKTALETAYNLLINRKDDLK